MVCSKHPSAGGTRVAHPVLPGFDLMEKSFAGCVEEIGLFEIAGMAGLRQENQACRGHRALEHQRRIQAGLVLVTAHDQQPHGYSLTHSQEKALTEINTDLAKPERMLRLLQSDVGSGKTVVALLAMARAVEAGGQAALMAPTGFWRGSISQP